MNYYDWKESKVDCSRCRWQGTGKQAAIGDSFDSGAEYHCPVCDEYFGFVAFPLISEVKSDQRADPVDRMALKIAERRG